MGAMQGWMWTGKLEYRRRTRRREGGATVSPGRIVAIQGPLGPTHTRESEEDIVRSVIGARCAECFRENACLFRRGKRWGVGWVVDRRRRLLEEQREIIDEIRGNAAGLIGQIGRPLAIRLTRVHLGRVRIPEPPQCVHVDI